MRPDDVSVLHNKGNDLNKLGKIKEAADCINRVKKLDPLGYMLGLKNK
jgi:hypothetical protein